MALSPLEILPLVFGGIGVDFKDFVELSKYVSKRSEEHKRNSYRERYHAGMRLISRERAVVTQLLYDLYANSGGAPNNEVALVRYVSGRGYTQRSLPLVIDLSNTIDESNLPKFQYSDLKAEFRVPTETEIADEVSKWDAAGLQFSDGLSYSLNAVNDNNYEFRGVRFLAYRATIASILDELGLVLLDKGLDTIRRQGYDLLPKRVLWLGSLNDLLSVHKRICLGGANVLFAIRTSENCTVLIIQRRSRYVSDEPGSISVVPKFFHESLIDPWDEVDIKYSFYREVYEELFSGEDKPRKTRYISPTFYLDLCEPVRELYESNYLELFPTSCAWDLLRGNYHFAYTAYVRDPDWWQRHKNKIRVNWEVDNSVEPVVRLSNGKLLSTLIDRQDWAPEAYYSFIEGLRALASHYPEDFPNVLGLLPELRYQKF